jgi:transcriptional regulator with XRE-family HTH domain
MQTENRVETPAQQLPGWLTHLRECITKKGITQEQLTSVLGVETRGAVGHYLNDRRQMTITQFSDLCRVVGLQPNEVLGFEKVHTEDRQREQIESQLSHQSSVVDNLKQCYREKIRECDEHLMQLRAANRHLTRQGASGAEDREQTLNTIRIVAAQRQCYLQAEADISAIGDELGVG